MDKLEKLMTEWLEDAKIDSIKIVEESQKGSLLHAKWLNVLFTFRASNKKLNEKRKKLEATLTAYYEGSLDGKDIGREPYQLIAKTQSKIDKLINTDSEMIELTSKITDNEECILYIKEVLDMIHKRGFTIKAIIDWRKFESGA